MRTGRVLVAAAVLLLTVGLAGFAWAGSGPTLAGCPVFPVDNAWNTPVDQLPVDGNSATYITTIGATKTFHPDFGAA